MALIDADDVGRRYGADPGVVALQHATLRVDHGDSVAVVGPSGSGKSTLLHILGCLDRPTSGTYRLDGVDTAGLDDHELARLRGERIGFVFQSFHLLAYRSALDNVMMAEVYQRRSRSGRRARALAALERVGLAHRADHLPASMSGGERQRVAIARAVVTAPPLLLCDEPTGNLDSATTARILALLDDLRRDGLTLVLITHDPVVAAHATRCVHIVDGILTEPSPNPARTAR